MQLKDNLSISPKAGLPYENFKPIMDAGTYRKPSLMVHLKSILLESLT